jgi:hypothetical protein
MADIGFLEGDVSIGEVIKTISNCKVITKAQTQALCMKVLNYS